MSTILVTDPTTGAQLVSVETVSRKPDAGEVQINANRRSTTAAPVPEADRIRVAILPAGFWSGIATTLSGEHSEALSGLLHRSLVALACERFKATLAENPLHRTVPLADYAVPALLIWSADNAATAGGLTFTKEQVQAFWPDSRIKAELQEKHGANEDKCKAVLELTLQRLTALAAKNHGINKASDADKLTTLLASDAATDSALVTEMLGRLAHISRVLTEKAKTETVSLEDV